MADQGFTQEQVDAEVQRVLSIYSPEVLRQAAASRALDVAKDEGATAEQLARAVVQHDFETGSNAS